MALTDTAVRATKPQARTRKLFDGGGLYLEVNPAGGKWWRWKYRFGGKEKRLSLGVYPDVSLKSARKRRDAVRQQLAAGIDPGQARKAQKLSRAGADSFEAIDNCHVQAGVLEIAQYGLGRAVPHVLGTRIS